MAGHLARHSIVIREPAEALEHALRVACSEDAVFATGSLFLVGDLRSYWSKQSSAQDSPHPSTVSHQFH
jgi:folylpolyglutamate synthase/dihydropteroate synthase